MQQIRTIDFASRFAVSQLHLKSLRKSNKELYYTKSAEYGKWARAYLSELGPAYIKLGQILSTRVDMFPEEFIRELESLQDSVNPVAFEDLTFDPNINTQIRIEPTPFKSASIGQIHIGTLNNGNKVVCKFLRPNVQEIITEDLKLFEKVSSTINVFAQSSELDMLRESVMKIVNETDYSLELQNARKFFEYMAELPFVRVPKVSESLSTGNMIVMEYIDAIKITDTESLDALGVDKEDLCKKIIKSYMYQIMNRGFFHADPHPGNLSVIVENGKPKLVFYDFGLVVQLDPAFKGVLTELFVHLGNKDTQKIVNLLIRENLIIPTSNIETIESFFDNLMMYFEDADIEDFSTRMMENEGLRDQFDDDVPFQLPIEMFYIVKTFVTIEGICSTLDPEFSYGKYLEDMIPELVSENLSFGKISSSIVQMPIQIENISQTVYNMEKSKANMFRKTNKKITNMQYSLIFAVLSQTLYNQENVPASIIAGTLCMYYFVQK